MFKVLNKSFLAVILFSFVSFSELRAQLHADAGNDKTICPGSSTIIGGSPSAIGGKPPYTYSWSPSTGLSNASSANPTASPSTAISYTLTVKDDTGAVAHDVMQLQMSYIYYQNAGNDNTICIYDQAFLGGSGNSPSPGVTFSWKPAKWLNDSTLPRPTATPLQTITYTLTVTQTGCTPKVSTVTVTVINLHVVASADVVINEGQTTTLHATGATHYVWSPSNTLTYSNTANPDAEPKDTTIYIVTGFDPKWQCSDRDTVEVFVIKGYNVYFYNTFTPNNDGNNDTWYIGNIYKYPDNSLDIYNRNSQLVYHADSYLNNWDGKSFGQDLPAATYFYVLDLGNGSGKYHGTVTIIK